MKVIIAKYEKYNKDYIEHMAVGYNITTDNYRTFYIDTLVELKDNYSDDQILKKAWDQLEQTILLKNNELNNMPNILGSIWNPSFGIIEENKEEVIEAEQKEFPLKEEIIHGESLEEDIPFNKGE